MTKRLEFSLATKRKAYELRGGKCPGLIELKMPCGKDLSDDCEYDHIKRNEIKPDNSLENCRPLCRNHHLVKTAMDAKQAAKGRRLRDENKPKRKSKINSRNTLSKEHRDGVKAWKERVARLASDRAARPDDASEE